MPDKTKHNVVCVCEATADLILSLQHRKYNNSVTK